MLTARADEPDVLRGFAGGADDYVTKPFSFAQLAARVHALLDRASGDRRATGSVLRSGDLEVDVDRHHVLRGGEPVELTPTEFRILVTLMREPGRVCRRGRSSPPSGVPSTPTTRATSDATCGTCGRSWSAIPRHPRYIVNERSVGYRFRAAPDSNGD